MRGFAVLLAYVVGLSAVVGIGIIGVMALYSSTKAMPSAQPVAAASQKERLAKPIKQKTVAEKEARPSQKRKAAHVTRKRKEEAPTMDPSGFNAYGYAPASRRMYQYPLQFYNR
jgi:hypothetical protein